MAGSVAVAILAATFYPFAPGDFDAATGSLSTSAQVSTITSLLFVPTGFVWLVRARSGLRAAAVEGRSTSPRGLLAATGIVALLVLILTALGAWMGGSAAIGLAVLAAGAAVAPAVRAHASSVTRDPGHGMRAASLVLVLVPTGVLSAHIVLAPHALRFSRERAMAHAEILIAAIEHHRLTHGGYPSTLVALWPEYGTGIVGIERFGYARHGSAYTLSFEQPELLFPNFGTVEVAVYNPQGEHLFPSHAAWLLDWPAEHVISRQGWYASHQASRPYWRSFLFD